MPTLQVVDMNNSPVGSIEIEGAAFTAVPHRSLLHRAVVMQRASLRKGNAATRGRGEVSGSGKKPWKQKHTGRARAGSARSPIWRHGGTVFGPQPRSYRFRIPKKVYRSALQGAVFSKIASESVVVLSELSLEFPKTRLLEKVLLKCGVSRGALVVVGEEFDQLYRSAVNLKHVKLVKVEGVNVYDLLRFDKLVIPRNQLERLQEVWS